MSAPTHQESTAAMSVSEDQASSSTSILPGSSGVIITDTGPWDGRHYCGLDWCAMRFSAPTLEAVMEHRRTEHLGTDPVEKPAISAAENGPETTTTTTANAAAAAAVVSREEHRCFWPGDPAISIPGGKAVVAGERCRHTFETRRDAELCACTHQHRIWCAVENIVFEYRRGS